VAHLAGQSDYEFLSSLILIDNPERNDIIIDVRHPAEIELKPLQLEGIDIITIPFYKLKTEIKVLDKHKRYLLFCERGVVSRLHAFHLVQEGYKNIGVYLAVNKGEQ